MLAHYVLLFAPHLACRAPGTPVPRKAGHPTGLPARAGQQRPGHTTPDPEPQANHFSHLSRWLAISQFLCYFATPVQVARTHRITRYTILVPSFFFLRYVFTEYPHIRAIMHSLPVSSKSPHAFGLSGFSLLCPRTLTSAQALTAAPETACIYTHTVHHSPPHLRLLPPKSRHA